MASELAYTKLKAHPFPKPNVISHQTFFKFWHIKFKIPRILWKAFPVPVLAILLTEIFQKLNFGGEIKGRWNIFEENSCYFPTFLPDITIKLFMHAPVTLCGECGNFDIFYFNMCLDFPMRLELLCTECKEQDTWGVLSYNYLGWNEWVVKNGLGPTHINGRPQELNNWHFPTAGFQLGWVKHRWTQKEDSGGCGRR